MLNQNTNILETTPNPQSQLHDQGSAFSGKTCNGFILNSSQKKKKQTNGS